MSRLLAALIATMTCFGGGACLALAGQGYTLAAVGSIVLGFVLAKLLVRWVEG